MSSFLLFVPKCSEAVPIDWSKVPEKSKQYFLHCWVHESLDEKVEEDTASEDTPSEETSREDISSEAAASKERLLPKTFGDLVLGCTITNCNIYTYFHPASIPFNPLLVL